MRVFFINFLVLGIFISTTTLNEIQGNNFMTNSRGSRMVRAPSVGEQCECTNIIVSSQDLAKKLHRNALGEFTLSSSHFNAFKSTVYRNSKSLTLIGGPNQTWRIHGGSRAGRILIRNKSCKGICPMDCSTYWEVYKRPSYEKDPSISIKCGDEDDGNEGSADGKESNA